MSIEYQKFHCVHAALNQCEEIKPGLTKQRVVLPSRGTIATWRNRQRNSMKLSFVGKAKSCTWGSTTQYMLAGKQLGRQSPAERHALTGTIPAKVTKGVDQLPYKDAGRTAAAWPG